jgi:hypothetical protein
MLALIEMLEPHVTEGTLMGEESDKTKAPLSAEDVSTVGETPHFQDFLSVSLRLLDGYADMARSGFRPEAVGLAMMGAVVNFHEMFDMGDRLPALLRGVADRLESKNEPH